jgi:hypothetical protein
VLLGVRARDVEAIRRREYRGVAVRGREHRQDDRPGLDLHSPDLDVLDRSAHDPLRGRDVAEQLLRRPRSQPGLRAQGAPLVSVVEERMQAVAEEVAGRLVTREQQDQEHRQQFVDAQALLLLGIDQRRDQIGRHRGIAVLSHELGEVRPELAVGLVRRHDRLWFDHAGLEAPDRARPAADELAVGRGDSEEVTDHHQRESIGEVRDVDDVTILELVQQGVRVAPHALFEQRDPARGERAMGDPAQALVPSAVRHAHVQRLEYEQFVVRATLFRGQRCIARFAGRIVAVPRGIADQVLDVVVARDEDAEPEPMSRTVFTDRREQRKRIGHRVGIRREQRDQAVIE